MKTNTNFVYTFFCVYQHKKYYLRYTVDLPLLEWFKFERREEFFVWTEGTDFVVVLAIFFSEDAFALRFIVSLAIKSWIKFSSNESSVCVHALRQLEAGEVTIGEFTLWILWFRFPLFDLLVLVCVKVAVFDSKRADFMLWEFSWWFDFNDLWLVVACFV